MSPADITRAAIGVTTAMATEDEAGARAVLADSDAAEVATCLAGVLWKVLDQLSGDRAAEVLQRAALVFEQAQD